MRFFPVTLQGKFLAGLVVILLLMGVLFGVALQAHTKQLLVAEAREKARLMLAHVEAIQHYVREVLRPAVSKRIEADDFIIEEVFYTGVKTPEGKNYNSSRYFKLVNNTNKILYADGLIIGQSEFLTSVNNNVTPYTPYHKFAIKGMMQLPGSGTNHPVNPGDFIVIADNAINHRNQPHKRQ